MVKRVYVEKRPGFDIGAGRLLAELRDVIGGEALSGVRVINRYDVDGISDELFDSVVNGVFSEPQSDTVSFDLQSALGGEGAGNASDADAAGEQGSAADAATAPSAQKIFAVEALPGQFDVRANSAAECIQLISQSTRPEVRYATLYVLEGGLSSDEINAIKHYIINPVETRETSLDEFETLAVTFPKPSDVEILDGFRELDEAGLGALIAARGLAMDVVDAQVLQAYFVDEGRDPSITEVKVVDTYWSDHCRHTTFGTVLDDVEIADVNVEAAFAKYLEMRHELGRDEKPICLMDMGTIGARWLKAKGILTDVDESDEINACTVKVKVDVDGKDEDWLYLFKNETHNHPTEIEPFGGAATCLGGAIRDPLSGRAYVYQAMRLTGAANPKQDIADTIAGKLPQRKIVQTAAAGYSSYGNQIGLATGAVNELYHPGYAAKRMEVGAVVGAAPAGNVRRECPAAGDVVVLLGGRTGRDGIGGATGSSKAHSAESIETCGAEVQKGNPPEERKIQRLFRNGEATRMIKRCNDFGAGGVSVAIGELADGIKVDLDAVPLKYMGLDGTEIAISESQERMAVALAPGDVEAFCALAEAENLEATPVAVVTAEPRVVMNWRGNTIVDISREFLNKNGAAKHATAKVAAPILDTKGGEGAAAQSASAAPDASGVATAAGKKLAYNAYANYGELDLEADANVSLDDIEDALLNLADDINISSKKGLVETFDSTIGAATVLMPFGGVSQRTPAQAMVSKLPVLGGKTTTVSGMAWGFDPYLSEANQFKGAYSAVVQSVAKLIATGFKRDKMWLSFQEYFEKLRDEPLRWGKPVASIMGALMAQVDLSVGAIGGKDSMSGSFDELDVPPTLISFATAVANIDRVISPEFKEAGDAIYLIDVDIDNAASITAAMDFVEHAIGEGQVMAASTPGIGGHLQALAEMCFGNKLGVDFASDFDLARLFGQAYGSFVVEVPSAYDLAKAAAEFSGEFSVVKLGEVADGFTWTRAGEAIELEPTFKLWESGFQDIFAYTHAEGEDDAAIVLHEGNSDARDMSSSRHVYAGGQIARPRVVIPVFPGTNCEYDTQAAFERAGADCDVFIINNLSPEKIKESTAELARLIRNAQIVMLPGGFSGGDEPDGSAKFITSVFRAPEITDAVRELLQARDGLMLGICNGFQALVKLGLVPYGDIVAPTPTSPTLTFNTLGRHQSKIVHTKVMSNLSPWLANTTAGEVYEVAISHGEGRFTAPLDVMEGLRSAGQIATQYVDEAGRVSGLLDVNPNGSVWAVEGITSPDGRVFGKMGHSERIGAGLYKNVPGTYDTKIFEAGVAYFK